MSSNAREHSDRRLPSDTADWIGGLVGGAQERAEDFLRRSIEGVERLLRPRPRARILELGCGSGRQAIELARHGYRVLGMDASAEILAPARKAISGQRLLVHFHAGDMRRIPFSEEFNAAISLQSPIGHASEKDDLECLRAVRRALKPEGKLLLGLVNREWLIARLAGSGGGCPSFDLRTGRLDCRGVPGGRPRPAGLGDSLRVYSLTEVLSLLERAELAFEGVWGDFEGLPYGIQSERMLVLAGRGPQREPARARGHALATALRVKGRPR